MEMGVLLSLVSAAKERKAWWDKEVGAVRLTGAERKAGVPPPPESHTLALLLFPPVAFHP